jgi:hypothetical protein
MIKTISGSFTDVGTSSVLNVGKYPTAVAVTINGTYTQVIHLQIASSRAGTSWRTIKVYDTPNATVADSVDVQANSVIRLAVIEDTSGTSNYTVTYDAAIVRDLFDRSRALLRRVEQDGVEFYIPVSLSDLIITDSITLPDQSIPLSAIVGAGTGGGYTGVLDQLVDEGYTAIFAASTKRLTGTVWTTGEPMARIRETGANDEENFSYAGLQQRMNFADIDAFVNGNTGRYTTWFNQAGVLNSGNAVQTVSTNQPLYVQNQGPSFNGTAYHFTIAHSANQLMTGGFTIAASLYAASMASQMEIIAKSGASSLANGYRLALSATTGKLNLRCNGAPSIESTSGVVAETATHVIASCAADGTVTFYINNVADGGGAANAASGITSTAAIRIGVNYNSTGQFFNGRIDDLFIIPGVVSEAARDILYAGRSF